MRGEQLSLLDAALAAHRRRLAPAYVGRIQRQRTQNRQQDRWTVDPRGRLGDRRHCARTACICRNDYHDRRRRRLTWVLVARPAGSAGSLCKTSLARQLTPQSRYRAVQVSDFPRRPRGTFTFSAKGAYEIALTSTVDRYVRLNCTGLGGATNFTVVGVVGVAGRTY